MVRSRLADYGNGDSEIEIEMRDYSDDDSYDYTADNPLCFIILVNNVTLMSMRRCRLMKKFDEMKDLDVRS